MADPSTSITVPTDGVDRDRAPTPEPVGRPRLDEPGRVRRLPRHDDPVRRLPVDQRPDFSTVVADDAVVGAQRLHDRVRRPADPGRPAGRPGRAAPDVPRRGRGLHRRLDAVRPGADRRAAGRRPDPAGRRRRRAGAGVAGPGPADVPPPRRSRSPWPSGARSARSPVPPARRSAPSSSSTSAGGGRSSSTCPSGSSASCSAAGCCPRAGRRNPGRLPDPARRRAARRSGWRSPPTASSQTDDWGWASTRVRACDARRRRRWSRVFVWRCRTGAEPAARPRAVRVPESFRWANAGTLVFAIGFNAMFLGNVLFLTQVWDYSIMRGRPGHLRRTADRGRARRRSSAGSPGASASGGCSSPAGWSGRSGGAASCSPARRRRRTTSAHYLPAVVLTGLGVALCLPQLSSAAVQGLPPDRFGSGSAVNQAMRNLGATLGVALVDRLHERPHPGDRARRLPAASGGCSWPAA